MKYKYMRIQGRETSYITKYPKGIFSLCWNLIRDEQLTNEEKELFISIDDWFKDNLPEPKPCKNHEKVITFFKCESTVGLSGGGIVPKPGEISLAHKGVLFLDELPEYKKSTLEILRQPMEEKEITLVRQSGTYRYPADFMLVGAMNPCPCGFYPDRERCRCTPFEVRRYLNRVSGPILDRMDICVEAVPMAFADMTCSGEAEGSAQVRERVMAARKKQENRFAASGLHFNADMGAGDVARYCALEEEELRYMERMFAALQLSARAYHRILKVARTIADLDNSDRIGTIHLAEAICYRQSDHKYWN